ncbi:MAG: MoaD/ThiS family protein [Chloroflexi bacterium AL-W]|nr:MoaD/ThiS family protein [Chloroflexi bacterium AL-N1]NOK68890.1 MoaD/ThiS family protein [Chloroflexi bacterium AL-N10]NOK76873.1 MoaD/ThiS family protein [Chloroflexi bacterium AL-N5]NOK82739.1 MoaD/ThiS family protein [Chloroflexi bacterium AL-W]NOK90730.1 MoaD/ThiS family protein [Chloroflexi bacterium AL-N15]
MSVTISIPTALRQYADGNATITVESTTIGQLLGHLAEQYPQLGNQLYNEQKQLRSFVNVYVGDEDIRHLQGSDTPVPDGEIVSIIPAIAGGINQ